MYLCTNVEKSVKKGHLSQVKQTPNMKSQHNQIVQNSIPMSYSAEGCCVNLCALKKSKRFNY